MVIRPVALSVFIGALLLGLMASVAEARGGRYGRSAAPAAPPASAEDPDAPARDPAQDASCPEPDPERPGAPSVTTPDFGGSTRDGVGRRTAVQGRTAWTWWYETNKERFEDLRARSLLTASTGALFGVGEGVGPASQQVPPRLKPETRAAVLAALKRVLATPGQHWIHTEAAALVALGKVAESPIDLRWHFDLLHPDAEAEEYLKESAILGFANLGREKNKGQLSAGLLDRVRTLLLAVLKSESYRPKTRGHAAVALALLSDQPSVHEENTGAWTAGQLFDAWIEEDLDEEAQVGLLVGLTRIDAKAVSPVMRLVLGGCALRGKAWPRARSGLVRAHAALALARIGSARDAKTLIELLGRTKGESTLVQQAAAIAAGVLGERFPESRGELGRHVLDALETQQEPGSRRLLLLTLGRLLAEEARAGEDYLLKDRKGGARLFRALEKAGVEERPFAALALGMAVRAAAEDVKTAAWHEFRRKATNALRDAYDHANGDARLRGAFAAGLGIAGDGNSIQRLLKVLEDKDQAPELRAHTALALGLLGDSRRTATDAVIEALRDPRSDLLQQQAATALGLMGDRDQEERERLLAILVDEMRKTPHQHVKAQLAITLGRIGDGRAVKPLMRILEDRSEPHLNRAMACAALGLLGEEGLHPALGPARWDSHYLSSSALAMDILDVL